jgi:ubiquinone/menaquinone biosynthesis C-methylase UbiE
VKNPANLAQVDSTRRFSSRVENYLRYRPRYPAEILDLLRTECGLTTQSVIADVGSGTGFLAELFLRHGNRVFGVEPNEPMRNAGEELLRNYAGFTSVSGTAEATTLPDRSTDFVTAGQAFHWFDREQCRAEFLRILRPQGWVVLVWNDRRTDSTPFLREYEQLLVDFSVDYLVVNHKQVTAESLEPFFRKPPCSKSIQTWKDLDLVSIEGLLQSASYVPEAGAPRHAEMMTALRELFHRRQADGKVRIEYDTTVFYQRPG